MSDTHDSRDATNPEEIPDDAIASGEQTPDAATQAILDRAAAERQEIANAHAAAAEGLPDPAKESRWDKIRSEIVDPSWRTIIVVLSTSGVSLILGLVLVFSYPR